MKKLLPLCAFALTITYVQAQTTAGHMMIGTNVRFSTGKNERPPASPESKSFWVYPQFGYFVADNFAVGLQVSYSNQKTTFYDASVTRDIELRITNTILSPFARYYMFTSNDKFAFYAQAMVGIGFTTIDYDRGPEPINARSISAQISPGFNYFITEKWVLDLQLSGISYLSYDPDTDSDAKNDKSASFTFNVSSLNPGLGFRYFIGN